MRRATILAVLATAAAACTGEIAEPMPSIAGAPAPTARPPSPTPAGRDGAVAPPTDRDGGVVEPTGAPVIERSTTRRLTRYELRASLAEVFGDDVPVAVAQLPDENLTPFDNDEAEQAASMRLVEALEAISIEVGDWAVADPVRLAALLPCAPPTPRDAAREAACFADAARSLGRRLWRRPLTADEVADAAPLLTDASADGTFAGGVRLLVRYLVLHPAFAYRLERGRADAPGELTAFEVATRLSLFLAGRAPDDALLDAAESGALATPEGRRAQATRLLDSAAGREQLRRLVAMWLGYSRLQDTGLERKMRAESDALVDRALAPGGDLRRLFDSDETFVDAELVAHYGLTGGAATPAWVPYGAADRRGILSHGAFAIAGAKFSDTSPTRRGRFIRERLFCQRIALPTVNVDVDQPPRSDDPRACKADRYVAHRTDPVCAGCHLQTDPLGFGMENLDQLGRYRTHDEGRPECTISGRGQLDGVTTFTGPRELAALVAASDRVTPCFAEHLIRFAAGRARHVDDAEAAAYLAAQAGAGQDVRAMLLAWVAHPNFARRVEEP